MIISHIYCTRDRAFFAPVIRLIAAYITRHTVLFFAAILWMLALPLAAQNQSFSLGDLSFSLLQFESPDDLRKAIKNIRAIPSVLYIQGL